MTEGAPLWTVPPPPPMLRDGRRDDTEPREIRRKRAGNQVLVCVDAVVRRWWLMLIAGAALAAGMFVVGYKRFETLHTARAQIIKQETASAFRQSESGEAFRPRDMTIPTFIKLMHNGNVVEAAAARLKGRYEEQVIRSGLIIAPERNTDVVSISITCDRTPEASLEILQAYTAEVLTLARELQRGSATEMREFLKQQIDRTDADLVKANEEILDYAKREQLIDAEKQMDAWLGELGNFTLKYETLKLDHETLDLRIQGVEKELAKVDTNAARLDTARRQVAELAVRYTDEHPTMIEAREKLAAMEERISACDPTDPPPAAPSGEVSDDGPLAVHRRDEAKLRAVRELRAKAPTGEVSDADLRAAFDNAERSAYTAAAQEGATARVAISLGVDAGIRAVRRVLERATVREAKDGVTTPPPLTDHQVAAVVQRAEPVSAAMEAGARCDKDAGLTSLHICRTCDASGWALAGVNVPPGWSRIERIDGPDSICPKCAINPSALDCLRDDGYEQAHVRPWTQPAVRDEGPRSPAREDVALTVGAALAARP